MRLINTFIQGKKFKPTLLLLGIISPFLIFLVNFSRQITSYYAAQTVEVYVITEPGRKINNFYKTSPGGKEDAFYLNSNNYFTSSDKWGMGNGYVQSISFDERELNTIRLLCLQANGKIYTWDKEEIKSDWQKTGTRLTIPEIASNNIPLLGAAINYQGNDAVCQKIMLPSMLMILVVLSLLLMLAGLQKDPTPYNLPEKLQSQLLNSSSGKQFLWICSISLGFLYLYNFFTLPPLVHAETFITFPQLANSPAEGFWANLPEKSFDLARIENGGYRPRALGFVIGYMDTNLMMHLNESIPNWGPRLPFTLLAAFLLVFSVFRITRTFFPTLPMEAALLAGCSFLFFQNFEVATFLYLRSAKVICPAVCLLLIDYYLRTRENGSVKALSPGALLSGLLIFIASTLDEQVLAVVFFLFVFSLFFRIKNKEASAPFYTLSISLVLYLIFYFLLGPALFGAYTDSINPHHHNFKDALLALNAETIERAGEIFVHLLHALCSNFFVLVPVIFICGAAWFKLRNTDKLTSIAMLLFAFALIAGVIGALQPSYIFKEQWNGVYFLPAACLILVALLYILAATEFNFVNRLSGLLLACFFLFTAFFNTQRINSFYNNYTSPHFGSGWAVYDTKDLMTKEHAAVFKGSRKEPLHGSGLKYLSGDLYR